MYKEEEDVLKSKFLHSLKILAWSLFGAIIIAGIHVSEWLSKMAVIPSGELFGLFITPLLCSFFVALLIEEDIKIIVYTGMIMTILSIVIITIVFAMPMLLGIVEAMDAFSVWVLQRLAISFAIVFPTTLIGGVIGGAIIS